MANNNPLTIIDIFERLQREDGDMRYEDYSNRLMEEWEKYSPKQKDAVNFFLIKLCGYSMDTILEEYEAYKKATKTLN